MSEPPSSFTSGEQPLGKLHLVPDLPGGASSHPGSGGGVQSGGGGDFGGGGADAGFDGAADAAFDAPADAFSGVLDEVASGAFEAAGAADEGVIVVIPVLAVFMVVLATVFGAGWLLWLSFGTEALLAVAVELAFAYTASRTVVQVEARAGCWPPSALPGSHCWAR